MIGDELEPEVLREIESLPAGLAEKVARHLVMAGSLIDDEPEQARLHTAAAHRLAARLPAVREACAITAYACEDYADALKEFRAVRRMTGRDEWLAYIADCERALGRGDRALEITKEALETMKDPVVRVELLLVSAGVRSDRGQHEAAVLTLQVPELRSRAVEPWVARLRFAYAEALISAGRAEDGLTWMRRAAEVDPDEETPAAERLRELSAGDSGSVS